MILGFTGPRHMPTQEQQRWMKQFVAQHRPSAVHHGACIGSDETMHHIAIDFSIPVVVHPPVDRRLMMDLDPWRNHPLVTILPARPYLARDLDIVNATTHLAATPDGPQRPASGTWYTINKGRDRARWQAYGLSLCWPDGKVY